jgi:CMP-N,N'-diacetyllegionaminic acid synthase
MPDGGGPTLPGRPGCATLAASESANKNLSETGSERDSASSLCLIPARGGSKSVVKKNIRPLNGTPLIVHSIRSAIESEVFNHVYVTTDDAEIATIAANHGAVIIPRPVELAQADTPMPPVVEHAIEWYKRTQGRSPHNIVLLQPTSPLRSADDIREAASILSHEHCDAVMGVFEANDPPQWGLRSDANGMLQTAHTKDQYLSRRQDLSPTYFDGPVYAIKTEAFLAERRFLARRTRFFVVPRLRAVDIDTEMDFLFAEFLAKHTRELATSAQSET